MNPAEYPHPERLVVPNELVAGGSEDWEVLEVFRTPATRLGRWGRLPFLEKENIEVALLMPKKVEPGVGFQMMLARIHKTGLSTLAAECIHLDNFGGFKLIGTGFSSLFFDTDHKGEMEATQWQRDHGHAEKIDELEKLIQEHKHTLNQQPPYLPAWQQVARKLAPSVAAFYLV
jgi:hypothetical protein